MAYVRVAVAMIAAALLSVAAGMPVGPPQPVVCPANSSAPPGADSALDCICEDGMQREVAAEVVVCKACDATVICGGGVVTQCEHGAFNVHFQCVCLAGSYCPGLQSGASCSVLQGEPCRACPHDHWCANNTLTACGANEYAPANSSRHSDCRLRVAAGSVAPQLVVCPAGSGTPERANASSVLACLCLPGFENETILGEDGEKCEPCRLGFYKEQLRNASCVRCAGNSWTLREGSASARACVCDAGHWRAPDAAACAACAAGSFKGAAGDGECAPCPLDHFCPEGAAAPVACPAHSSAEAGRAAAEECLCGTGFRAWRVPLEVYPQRGWNSEHGCRACADGEAC